MNIKADFPTIDLFKTDDERKVEKARQHFVELNTPPPIFFDIETAPTEDEEVIAEFWDSVKMPILDLDSIQASANLKDPDKIAADIEKRRAKAEIDHANALLKREDEIREKISKTTLDGSLCRVVGVGFAYGDDEVSSCIINIDQEDQHAAERDLLEEFFDTIHDDHLSMFVGHNLLGFDIPVLTKRAMAHGLKLPAFWPWPYSHSSGDARVFDTQARYTGSRHDHISLDKLCRRLGVKGKLEGVEGADFHKFIYSGDPEKFDLAKRYLIDDVEAVRSVWRKMTYSLNHPAVNENRTRQNTRDFAYQLYLRSIEDEDQ